MYNRKRLPPTQHEISTGKPEPASRADEVRRDTDKEKELKIGLYDIDFAIKYYFDNTIRPTVQDNGTQLQVPVIYGSPEKWKNVRKDGFFRDKVGKILCPVIAYRRTSIEKNRGLGSKVDGNYPATYWPVKVTYTKENRFDQFSLLNNSQPQPTTYNVIVPDYVNITYDVIMWTDYVEQMNGLLESIIYSEGSYWGDMERFKFRTKVDTLSTVTDLQSDNDRIVRSTFSLNVYGYIVTDALVKKLSKHRPDKSVGKNTTTTIFETPNFENEEQRIASGSL